MITLLDKPIHKGPYKLKKVEKGGLLPMVSDVVFNSLLSNKEGLKYASLIISELLKVPYDEIYNSIEYNKNVLGKENINNRERRVDFLCKIDGKYVNIEMNNYSNYPGLKLERNIEYEFNIYSNAIDKYNNLDHYPEVIQINLNNFSFEGCSDDIHLFMLKEVNKDYLLTNKIKIYQIYLPKIREKYYNKDKLTRLDKLLLTGNEEDKELIKNIITGDGILEDFYKKRDKVSSDDFVLGEYDGELYDEMFKGAAKEEGYKQGFEQGIEQGIGQGIEQGIEQGTKNKGIEIAKKLLFENMSLEKISEITNLSMDEIEKLRK